MAGLRSAYELKKWQAIQTTSAAPLQRVIKGQYTQQDIDSLGTALKDYDDLAYSVFAEGVRLAELAAKKRVDTVQSKRQEKSKKPLTARQIAIIYSQAVDKAQKETMPQLLDAIKELLEAKGDSIEAATESAADPEARPKLSAVPKLQLSNYSLSRLDKEQRAANDDANEELVSKWKALDLSSWKERFKQIRELLGTHDKDDTEEEKLEKAKKTEEKLLGRMEKVVKDLEFNAETNAYTGTFINPKSQTATPVEGSLQSIDKQLKKIQKQDEEKSKAEVVKDNSAEGFLSRFFRWKNPKRVTAKEAKAEKEKEEKDKDKPEKEKKESSVEKAGRAVGKNKRDEENKGLFNYIRSKYAKVSRMSGAPNSISGIAMLALGLTTLGGVITGFVEKFTNIDVMQFIKDAFSKSYEWVVDKIFNFLGIERKKKPEVDVSNPPKKWEDMENLETLKARQDAKQKATEPVYQHTNTAGKAKGFEAKMPYKEAVEYSKTHIFTPREAQDFEKVYAWARITVPKSQIQGKDEDEWSKPVVKPPKSNTGRESPYAASTPTVAKPAEAVGNVGTPNVESKPSPTGKASAEMPTGNMPLRTESRGSTVAANPQQSKPGVAVTATPPPPAMSVAPTGPQQSKAGGSSKPGLNIGSVPTHQSRSEASGITNFNGVSG